MALLCEFHPVSFIQLRPNQKVQILDLIIFTQQGRGQPELALRGNGRSDLSEHGCRHNVDFVKNHETPFPGLNPVHHLLCIVRPSPSLRHHRVCRNDNTSGPTELFFVVGCEHSNISRVDIRPPKEFVPPLHHRHGTGTEDDSSLFDSATSCDAYQGFSGTTGQNNNTTLCSTITEHFAQTLLLVVPNPGIGLQVNIKVRVNFIVSEIIFLQGGTPHGLTTRLDRFHRFVWNLKTMDLGLFLVIIVITDGQENFILLTVTRWRCIAIRLL